VLWQRRLLPERAKLLRKHVWADVLHGSGSLLPERTVLRDRLLRGWSIVPEPGRHLRLLRPRRNPVQRLLLRRGVLRGSDVLRDFPTKGRQVVLLRYRVLR